MAEFQEVMRQYDRMCSHYEECADCPFHRNVIWCIKKIGGKRYVNENAKPAEEIIMSWAAEHPEPIYPTWIEWLKSIGIIPYLDGRVVKRDYDDNYLNGHVNVNEIIFKSIPKDVAEKLGIEPKEG